MSEAAPHAPTVLAIVPACGGVHAASGAFDLIPEAVPLAAAAGSALHALVLTPVADAALGARTAAEFGAARIWILPIAEPLADPRPEDLVTVLAGGVAAILDRLGPTRLVALLAAGAGREDIAARLAVRREGVALGRCTSLALTARNLIAQRAACGGRASLRLECAADNVYAVLRAAARGAARPRRAPTEAESATSIDIDASIRPMPRAAPMGGAAAKPTAVEAARVVVCGGRGLGSADAVSQLAQLAACLGGAVAGTLPAVDAGWMPVAFQVGQSGKYVAPELYVAVGVSGTPQHMAGIDPRTPIVAINSDRNADIFRFADIGLVADWRDAVPALIAALRAG